MIADASDSDSELDQPKVIGQVEYLDYSSDYDTADYEKDQGVGRIKNLKNLQKMKVRVFLETDFSIFRFKRCATSQRLLRRLQP